MIVKLTSFNIKKNEVSLISEMNKLKGFWCSITKCNDGYRVNSYYGGKDE